MKNAIALLAAATAVALAGCDRPSTTSSTTVVKEPVAQNAPAVQKEKETVIQKEPVIQKEEKETIVQAPSQPAESHSSSTNVTIDAGKPETTEKSRSTRTTRVDTPAGTATRTETQTTKTTQ